jgi:GPN-loop GTPase
MYKTKLPFILVFNKTDAQPHDFAIEWMQDFEAFQVALASHSGSRDSEGEPTYMNSLMNSMSLVLDEFYKHLKVIIFHHAVECIADYYRLSASQVQQVPVSRNFSMRWRSLVKHIGRTFYLHCSPCFFYVFSEYLPELERARAAREKSLQDIKEDSINRLMKDLAVDRAANPKAAAEDRWASDEEDIDDDDELEVNLIDRSE